MGEQILFFVSVAMAAAFEHILSCCSLELFYYVVIASLFIALQHYICLI